MARKEGSTEVGRFDHFFMLAVRDCLSCRRGRSGHSQVWDTQRQNADQGNLPGNWQCWQLHVSLDNEILPFCRQ